MTYFRNYLIIDYRIADELTCFREACLWIQLLEIELSSLLVFPTRKKAQKYKQKTTDVIARGTWRNLLDVGEAQVAYTRSFYYDGTFRVMIMMLWDDLHETCYKIDLKQFLVSKVGKSECFHYRILISYHNKNLIGL